MAIVLCIEDEPDLRADLVEELRDVGYETHEATNGVEGLEAILKLRPDLVICDVTMPELNGIDMFNRLRSEHPSFAGVRFIFLSALEEAREQLGGGFEADGYLAKPVDFDTVLEIVASLTSRQTTAVMSAN